jgi:hypothetical protein
MTIHFRLRYFNLSYINKFRTEMTYITTNIIVYMHVVRYFKKKAIPVTDREGP